MVTKFLGNGWGRKGIVFNIILVDGDNWLIRGIAEKIGYLCGEVAKVADLANIAGVTDLANIADLATVAMVAIIAIMADRASERFLVIFLVISLLIF